MERATLLDLAKVEYAERMSEGAGKIPVLPEISATSTAN